MRAAIALFASALLIAGCGSGESTTTPETSPGTERTPTAGASSAPAGLAAHRCGTAGALTRLRAVGVACEEARRVAIAWDVPRCRPPSGGSRSACSVERYRCQGVVAARGLSVSCSRPGQSISFLRPR